MYCTPSIFHHYFTRFLLLNPPDLSRWTWKLILHVYYYATSLRKFYLSLLPVEEWIISGERHCYELIQWGSVWEITLGGLAVVALASMVVAMALAVWE